MSASELDALKGYGPDFPFHDENLLTLHHYTDRLEAAVRRRPVRRLLSLGIGHGVVARRLGKLVPGEIDEYTIIEGSQARIDELMSAGDAPRDASVVHGLFETCEIGGGFEMIEMGFVLEHVVSPLELLRRYRSLLAPGGMVAIAVPNARSLHRLIGHEAGLLPDLYQLSEHDLALGHRRYFDRSSLRDLVGQAGLRAGLCEGILLKALTTSQLRQLGLGAEVMRAFLAVGRSLPEIANAIYLEAMV